MKQTKEQEDRIKFSELPGLHIRYTDRHIIRLIFDGFDLPLDVYYFNPEGMRDRGKNFRNYMAGILQARYSDRHHHTGQVRSEKFCHLMAAKIYRKVRRLPQTEIWLLHRQ